MIQANHEDDPNRRKKFCEGYLEVCEKNAQLSGNVQYDNKTHWEITREIYIIALAESLWIYILCNNTMQIYQELERFDLSSKKSFFRQYFESFLSSLSTWTHCRNLLYHAFGYEDAESYFQQDDASAYDHRDVKAHLDPNRWVVQKGSIQCLAGSLCLAPVEFFLWKHF